MGSRKGLSSNFAHLQAHDEQLLRVGMLAERYFREDPNTCLIKLRQFGEILAQLTASLMGVYQAPEERQYDLLSRLRDSGIIPREVHQLFSEIRRSGNEAAHQFADDRSRALDMLKMAWQLSLWFHRTFQNPAFKSGPFIPPQPPEDQSEALKEKLRALEEALAQHEERTQEQSGKIEALSQELKDASGERAFWEQMATEAERDCAAINERLASLQAETEAQSVEEKRSLLSASSRAASQVQLDEAETRLLIDGQLQDAGWRADSETLRYAKGARPQKGINQAIAEWPTKTGPADYVLFVGLVPIAVVEAKRKNLDVSAALQQAKRYSRGFRASPETQLHSTTWGREQSFQIPFVYSTNGRPYLKQLETASGIWFCDLRRPTNLSTPLQGWHSPEGLSELLKLDKEAANAQLKEESFNYGFTLREYQKRAILRVEQAIEAETQSMLLAMATGTGKTKTCIALIYRLLKTQRFRRILFLVDRSALGEQAANAFKDTRMEGLQNFADIFGTKELDDKFAETDTMVHLATVQGMVSRVLSPVENTPPPTIDTYDCIVVDECHRGYLLDREMSETELSFRSQEDYISSYRRVIEYFDAVKIGLTATPALHTSEIFGAPIFTYSYREAVIDGFLIDHEPPIRIETKLSRDGIVWKKGEEVAVMDGQSGEVALHEAPDEIKIEVAEFNRKVVTKEFNRVVCDYLAGEIDPEAHQKTLIFCATDTHADLVVSLLKKSFAKQYGSVDDDAVLKITGTADKPLQLIRRFKNEQHPSVAVTVDLLTTGIDVPEICNLVFLRRINSRILFDQMLGRATRLCDEIGKETFRIFDAVRIYEALEKITKMKPVVVNPEIGFSHLIQEITQVTTDEARQLVKDQLLAKFQRKKRHLSAQVQDDFKTLVGFTPEEFAQKLKALPLARVAEWFTQLPDLGEFLDRKRYGPGAQILISAHEDELTGASRGYGSAHAPEDFLEAFGAFVKSKGNEIPALFTVVTRPRDLTRKQLKELTMELDRAGYSVAKLHAAWRQMTNQEIAASIVGFIRQAALGDPLVPFAERVDHALNTILASRDWKTPQREWLKKIAAQTKANQLVDREALNDPNLIFRREGGGPKRLDRIFDGELFEVLDQFNEAVWRNPAS